MPTMKEIAKKANVSVSTVSLVLNNKQSRISKIKKEEIKQIAKEMNYTPNIAAVSLSKNISFNVGLIVPDITNPFFATLTKLIDQKLRIRGYSTLLVDSNNSFEIEKSTINNMVARGVDGIILVPSNEFFSISIQKQKNLVKNCKKPLILLNAYTDLPVSYVNFDNVTGAYLATQELINYGHQNIAFIKGKKNFVNAKERLQGYKSALKDNQIKINSNIIFEGDYTLQAGYKLAPSIIKIKNITGIVSSNDLMLFGIIKWAKSHHLDIFNRLSMVGFDNDPYSEIIEVPLTTIDQNPLGMVNNTIKLLMTMIIDKKSFISHSIIKPQLIKRQSVKKI